MAIDLLRARDYIEHFLRVQDKRGKIVPLKLNTAQEKLYGAVKRQHEEGRPVRIVVLKARQMGFSTLTEALLFWNSATRKNVNSMVLAHTDEATANIFRMTKRYYDCLPEAVKPDKLASNAQELVFDRTNGRNGGLGSRIRCATAGGKGVGRSYTLSCVHMSEFAFWPGKKMDTYTGLMQAVPDLPGTMVIMESTANGYDEFKRFWDDAVEAWERGERDGFEPLFFAWWEMEEYRRPVPDGFTPTEEERALQEAYGLDSEQLCWRRWCIKTNCGGDVRKFRQEYPASPDEAFLASGACVFDKEALVLRRERAKKTAWERGGFRFTLTEAGKPADIHWEANGAGPIRIRVQPEEGKPYVIGGDTAGTGSDRFTGQVLDNTTGEQVAVLQHQFDETMYARQMYCLGLWYNRALIGVETNYSTYPQKELERLGYPNLFHRLKEDTFTGKTVEAYGFETTATTRPLVIDILKEVAREHLELIWDDATIGEMLSFVYNERFRPEAEAGAHDDLVMALAIAHYIRPQQRTKRAERVEPVRKRLSEQYRNKSRKRR
ncbi:MAG: hypothetical protein HFF09_06640 [Oscillospiraceae bacterium]|nr:hypothetical protein [Oscillospiraceae bacterium]